MIKVFLITISLVLITSMTFGLPTQKQLNEYCIPVIMQIDNDVHWFYYKHIVSFDEKGLRVKFGKNLSKEAFYPASEILNLQESIKRFNEIREKYQ